MSLINSTRRILSVRRRKDGEIKVRIISIENEGSSDDPNDRYYIIDIPRAFQRSYVVGTSR